MNVADLIRSIDIVEFISRFVDLKQRGNEWWGLSCFKEEKTPSFSVKKSPPFFYDYSSGRGGNVYNFVKAYYGCSSRQAIEILQQYAGVDKLDDLQNASLAAVSVCKMFRRQEGREKECTAADLPDNYMDRYVAQDDKLDVWRREGISDESLKRFQVKYDPFSDRLVYPIRSAKGKIQNVGGRALASDWKERGMKKYCYFFKWGRIETIYGFAENAEAIRAAGEIILFEGCKSVLLADSWGIKNCGALLTSHLSQQQMRLLVGLGCRVVFALDKDVNPTEDKHIQRLKRYVNVEYLSDGNGLLDDKDAPVDKGKEVFEKLYAERRKLR